LTSWGHLENLSQSKAVLTGTTEKAYQWESPSGLIDTKIGLNSANFAEA
jgi:hypothetical protein